MKTEAEQFTDRALLVALHEHVALAAHVARTGATLRALAKERGIKVPKRD